MKNAKILLLKINSFTNHYMARTRFFETYLEKLKKDKQKEKKKEKASILKKKETQHHIEKCR